MASSQDFSDAAATTKVVLQFKNVINVPKMDTFGWADPYVVATTVRKTDGGLDEGIEGKELWRTQPEKNSKSHTVARCAEFTLGELRRADSTSPTHVRLRLFDMDRVSKDELIGVADVPILNTVADAGTYYFFGADGRPVEGRCGISIESWRDDRILLWSDSGAFQYSPYHSRMCRLSMVNSDRQCYVPLVLRVDDVLTELCPRGCSLILAPQSAAADDDDVAVGAAAKTRDLYAYPLNAAPYLSQLLGLDGAEFIVDSNMNAKHATNVAWNTPKFQPDSIGTMADILLTIHAYLHAFLIAGPGAKLRRVRLRFLMRGGVESSPRVMDFDRSDETDESVAAFVDRVEVLTTEAWPSFMPPKTAHPVDTAATDCGEGLAASVADPLTDHTLRIVFGEHPPPAHTRGNPPQTESAFEFVDNRGGIPGVIRALRGRPSKESTPVIFISPLFNSAPWMRDVDEMTDDHVIYGQLYYPSAATTFGLLGRQGLGFPRSYGMFVMLTLASVAGPSHPMFLIGRCSVPFTKPLFESLLGYTIPAAWFQQYVRGVAIDQGRTDTSINGYPPAKVQMAYAAKWVPAAENALLEAAVPSDVPLVNEFYAAYVQAIVPQITV